MAKKKNKTQSLAVGAIALFFGVLALCLGGFLAAVKVGGLDRNQKEITKKRF